MASATFAAPASPTELELQPYAAVKKRQHKLPVLGQAPKLTQLQPGQRSHGHESSPITTDLNGARWALGSAVPARVRAFAAGPQD